MEPAKPTTRWEKTMRLVAWVQPFVGPAFVLLNWAQDQFRQRHIGALVLYLVPSLVVSRYSWRRAHNLEAAFFTTRTLPTEPRGEPVAPDIAAVTGALALMLFPIFNFLAA
jgi:hypothetical protein